MSRYRHDHPADTPQLQWLEDALDGLVSQAVSIIVGLLTLVLEIFFPNDQK